MERDTDVTADVHSRGNHSAGGTRCREEGRDRMDGGSRQARRLAALLATLALILAACGGSTASNAPSAAAPAASTAPGAATPAAASSQPSASGSAAGGGALSIAFAADMQHLDPALAYDTTSWTVTRMLYDQLVMYAPNSTELVPGLAEAMPT